MRTLEPTPHEMPSGGADLRTTVLELADADEKLSEEAKLLILEALESDAGAARSSEPGDEMPPPAEPANAYLKSISVRGFRGVGPDLRVPLNAGPGLVVISGRNGSGKSTIAEALELTLTGKSFRWHNRTAVWSQNWRNLHGDGDASIRLELAEENGGPITIGVDWAPGAELGRHSTWAQRPGAKRAFGADPLGWAGPLELYRPLLSYDELGGVLDGQPKDLYDKLNVLLGLDRITEAQQRLNERVKQLQGPQQDLKTHSVQVKNLLAGSDDERAQHASTLLAKYKKDIAAVEALAIGTQAPRFEPVQRLRGLAQLTVPTGQQVSEAAGRLRSAVAGMADRAGTLAEQAELHADLLDQALRLHDAHGEQSCPICGIGVLDSAWAQRTRDAMEQERSTRADLAAARSAVTVARREARTLIPGVTAPARVDGFDLPELSAAVTAFELWTAAPNDDLALADHLDGAIGPLTESYTALQSRAAALVTEHEDRWAPIAVQLAHWVDLARKADTAAPQMTNAKQAADWLKANTATLRNQRIAPLADRARHIWATLRQESNVDLGAIRLEGSANRRHVELRASVDGEEAGALGVMSQGELHALALALFLPRATAPESPFRFIVLDDPIQAMDPSKVEGFVRVMAELAVDRQVIVLSHDDRLADAVRRSSLKASMFEVTRGARSVVSVRETLHPAMRYLDDAWALTKDEAVPEEAKRRVVPGLCRSAFEAAAFEVYSAKSHGRGVSRITVEQEWEKARTVKDRLGLALGTHSEAQTTNWVQGGAARKRALYVTNRGVHGPIDGDLADDSRDLRLAIKDLREGRP